MSFRKNEVKSTFRVFEMDTIVAYHGIKYKHSHIEINLK